MMVSVLRYQIKNSNVYVLECGREGIVAVSKLYTLLCDLINIAPCGGMAPHNYSTTLFWNDERHVTTSVC